MIDGRARGSSTFVSNCLGLAPNASAASLVLSGTWRIPRAVRRTIGGMEKMTVARIPGGLPMEKNAMAGSR